MEDTLAADRLVRWGNFHACVFDRASMTIRACSDSLAELAGRERAAELIGSYVIDLFSLESLAAFEALLRGGDFSQTAQCRMAGTSKLDTRMAIALSTAPQDRDSGLLTMICIPVFDQATVISELDAKADALTLRNAQLAEFSSLLVHDLRGLLHNLSGELELLLLGNQDDLNPKVLGHLSRIEQSSGSMTEVLQGIARLLRPNIGDYPAELTDLNELVDSVLATPRLPSEAGASIKRTEHLPTLTCQKQLIEEVFRNLVENSVNYRSTRPLLIEVGGLHQDPPTFFVKDNGVGIHRDDVSGVLDPLRRADRQHLNSEGTGMGLALVQRIVEQHGGKVWLESEPGRGTTVWFTLSEHGPL